MSYDLAVWEGPPPLSNAHAGSECERRLAAPESGPPVPSIASFLDRLVSTIPDGASEAGPWAHGPPMEGAAGTMAYFSIERGRIGEVRPVVGEVATAMNLVAFDPQTGELIPSAITIDRTADFDLPPRGELAIHLAAVIGEALDAPGAMAGVVEQIDTGFYIQWMAKDRGLTVEAQGETVVQPQLALSPEGREGMKGLGFIAADPNWSQHWPDGIGNLEHAAQVLAAVFEWVRAVPPDTPMRLQTFPV